MKKKIFIFYFSVFYFLFFTLTRVAFAQAFGQEEQRALVIEKSLTCIEQNLSQESLAAVDWNDVCFTPPVQESKKISREEIIDGALDAVEFQNSYFSVEPVMSAEETNPSSPFFQTHMKFRSGYRKDNAKWNIASDGTGRVTPNILSELTWSDVEISQVQAGGNITLGDKFIIEGMTAVGDVFSGDNQDSDYLGNNRTSEFSRSNNHASDGETEDFSGALGYKVALENETNFLNVENLWATFLAGYSYHKQRWVITEGFQTIPANGPFANLNSRYTSTWEGPWAGIEFSGKQKQLSGSLRFEYHRPQYYGEGNWNLRSDFEHPVSFEHLVNNGQGLVFSVDGNYHIRDNWLFNINANFQDWKVEEGLDRTFFSDGTTSDTLFRESNWESYALMLGSVFQF